MAMVIVVAITVYSRIYWLRLIGLVKTLKVGRYLVLCFA